VLSSRIKARPIHRVRDVACGGAPVEVLVRKRRLACLEPQCPRRSFGQTTDEIPLRSRLTSRLVAGIVADLSAELRAVSRVAAASGVSWTTAMRVMEDTPSWKAAWTGAWSAGSAWTSIASGGSAT
jgi:transposase